MSVSPLNICVLGVASGPHVISRTEVFKRLGHDVRLVSPVDVEVTAAIPVTAPNLRLGRADRWLRPFAVLALVAGQRADVFHAHYAAELTSWAAWLLRKRPLAVSVMGGDVLFEEQGALGPLGRWLTISTLRGADLVTVKSKLLARRVVEMGVAPERVRIVVWGVDRTLFRPVPSARAAVRASWGVPLDAPLVFSPRLLQPLYQQHVMVEAICRVPGAWLAISTFKEDRAYGDKVRARAAELDVSDRIVFVPPRPIHDMAEAYSASDIVLSLPSSDGFPQSVLEAMACGAPVVMTDLERYREYFDHRQSALFVPAEPDAVAAALRELIADAPLRQLLAREAAAIVARDCDFDTQARAVEAELLRLAAR